MDAAPRRHAREHGPHGPEALLLLPRPQARAHVRALAQAPGLPGLQPGFGRKELRLGVSPGWADIYPSSYHENWISITGLRGCFAFVHRADPLDDLIEEREDDNIGVRTIRLPPRRGSVAPRGCPGPR